MAQILRSFALLLALAIFGGLLGACTETQPTTSPAGASTAASSKPVSEPAKDEAAANTPTTNPILPGTPMPVPGKPGFVFNPYGDNTHRPDVTSYPPGTEIPNPQTDKSSSGSSHPPGTEVRDPQTGKSYLIP